jgi:hypothetical protein
MQSRIPRRLAVGASALALAMITVVGATGGVASAEVTLNQPVLPASAAPKPPDPALALAVAQWVADGGEANLKTLAADFTDLESAANSNNLPSISTSCAQLQKDVEGAQSGDPIPDPEAQSAWSRALAQYERGATDCVAGADESNVDLITKASTEITSGSTDLDLVTTRLGEIAGS